MRLRGKALCPPPLLFLIPGGIDPHETLLRCHYCPDTSPSRHEKPAKPFGNTPAAAHAFDCVNCSLFLNEPCNRYMITGPLYMSAQISAAKQPAGHAVMSGIKLCGYFFHDIRYRQLKGALLHAFAALNAV